MAPIPAADYLQDSNQRLASMTDEKLPFIDEENQPLLGDKDQGEEKEQDYFHRIAARSDRHTRAVTLVTLALAGFCYYLLFGGQLPSLPQELRFGSLPPNPFREHAGKTHPSAPAHHGGCGGMKAMPAADREAVRGYWSYVARSAGLNAFDRPHHHHAQIENDASRGGVNFSNQVDVSVSSTSYAGSHLSQMYESLFLATPTPAGARNASYIYTNRTHISGTIGDYNTALFTAQRWGELLGADMPSKIESLVYESGSKQSRKAVMGADSEHHHHKGHRHFWEIIRGGRKGDHHRKKKHHHKHPKQPKGPTTEPRVIVDTYHVWLNTPVNSSLTLSAVPSPQQPAPAPSFTAGLIEDQIGDDTNIPADVVPGFHGYSKSGRVEYAEIVYANKGRKEDYEALEKAGIDLKGKVVLVRYGGPFRGLKVRGAASHGAAACLIYTDPSEDGEVTAANGYEAYPEGPARQPSSIQRGSVQALSLYPGDPSTPGAPSYKNATRLDPEEADSLPKIPSLPLSYRDATPLLRSLQGKGKPVSEFGKDWQGAVPNLDEDGAYWTGPNPDVVVSLENFGDLKTQKIWNVYAVIPGHIQDEVVVVGNHRDAWTFGAADPSSGSAVFEEIIKGLGLMVEKGWKPLRTIFLASWDAEEFGLVGSTEFAEDYADWLQENTVAYFNLDVAVAGSDFNGHSSPSLTNLIQSVASTVDDPSSPIGANKKLSFPRGHALGSGSDFTGFLQYLGIASVDMGFSRAKTDPVYMYHSSFDSFSWMDSYGDPTWQRHTAMAKAFGLSALKAATNLFVPLNLTAYAEELSEYVDRVAKLNSAGISADLGPLRESVKQVFDASVELDAEKAQLVERLQKALRKAHDRQKQFNNKKPSKKPGHKRPDEDFEELKKIMLAIRTVNSKVAKFEQGFIDQDGLSERTWYKHLGVAPGRFLGYGATTFPGVTESITLDGGKDLDKEMNRLVKHLDSMAGRLRA